MDFTVIVVNCFQNCILAYNFQRKTLSFASTIGTKDPMKFNEIILTNCWLGGDEELKTNDDYFLAVSGTLSQLIVIKEAQLEKL